MFLLDWYQQFLRIRREAQGLKINLEREVKEVEVCQSCETLREQLAMSNAREQRLMDRLMEKPEKIVDAPPTMVTRPVMGKHVPWRVRQQAIETEDREKAKLMRTAPQPSTTEDLEKELDIASANRNAEAEKR